MQRLLAASGFGSSMIWIVDGAIVIAAVAAFGLEKEVYLLGGLLAAYGIASILGISFARSGKSTMLSSIVGDFAGMPPVMKRLAVAQFFS